MIRIKERFKGERSILLPEVLLEEYAQESLIETSGFAGYKKQLPIQILLTNSNLRMEEIRVATY